ncbi:MAG: glycosyltransferase, exosortase A system-associated [Gammaproteobacteria bacterium]|nr:MAG: glycosyltransferase, exosortase A system-associated [Gammaproteobacteria bacterium]
MKILHLFDHSLPLHSGYTFRSRAILREQRARGWETVHVTSAKHNRAAKTEGGGREEADGLTFHRSRDPRGWKTALPPLEPFAIVDALAERALEVARRERPDVLHAHSPALDGLAALRVGRRLGLPVVYEIRAFWEDAAVDHGTAREGGLRYRLTRALETYVARRADALVTICEGLKQDLVARGIPEEKITVVPNAVDLQNFQADVPRDKALARALELGEGPVLGFLGSFYAYEGLDLLIEALPRIAAALPGVRLLLVGGGPQETTLKARVAALRLEERVVFTGRVPHAEVGRYYGLVDILVYPRKSMRLTELVTPLKPLEAMAQRKLVVASDVGGHRELIRDGVTGSLFRAGDADALAAAVIALASQPEAWEARRDAGLEYVRAERTWPTSVARYAPVYERLAGGKRR